MPSLAVPPLAPLASQGLPSVSMQLAPLGACMADTEQLSVLKIVQGLPLCTSVSSSRWLMGKSIVSEILRASQLGVVCVMHSGTCLLRTPRGIA